MWYAPRRQALTRATNDYARDHALVERQLSSEDLREGLTAIVAVKLVAPMFSASTKSKPLSPEVADAVTPVISDPLRAFFDDHPEQARAIVTHALRAGQIELGSLPGNAAVAACSTGRFLG